MRDTRPLLFGFTVILAALSVALRAADEQSSPSTPQKGETTPREVLDPLLQKCEWQAKWVEDIQAYRVAFKGPDVYVRLAGEFVVVQSYLGRLPKTVPTNDLIRLLRKNYDLYQGKFGLDKDMDLWFDLATSRRILDAEELNRQIAFAAAAAQDASSLIKTETPSSPTS